MLDETTDRYRAPALDKGLDILEVLADSEEGLTQTEIANALERTPNEIYRMLDRLVRRNYVVRQSGDRYELTLKLFSLAHLHPPVRRLVNQAMPTMRRVAAECAQAVFIAIYDRGDLNSVAHVDPPGHWGVSIRVGARIGLFSAVPGLVLLAFSTPSQRAFMLAEHVVEPGETIPPDLDTRLEVIRSSGYCMVESKQMVGVMMISVPITGPGGSAIAALTIPQLARVNSPQSGAEMCIKSLMRAGGEISSILAGPGRYLAR